MIRTPSEIRAEFAKRGISIAAWATAHNFSSTLVFEVLAGRKKCIRGQCHNIAVLLGLKEGEIVAAGDFDLRVSRAKGYSAASAGR